MEDQPPAAAPVVEEKKAEKKEKTDEPELSEEDQALKDGLELAVTRLQDTDEALHETALDYLIQEIRSSTSSMTAVPKPLKFLRPHYDTIKNVYESWPETHKTKTKLADVLSVLAMTMSTPGSREALRYKLIGTPVDIASWGHEYARYLSGEISEEFNRRIIENVNESGELPYVEDLIVLVVHIVPFQIKHNAEAEAVDLLIEVRQLDYLLTGPKDLIDDRNYERICLYMIRCADYMSDPDDILALLNNAYHIYKNQGKYCDALRVALKMNDVSRVSELFSMELDIPMIMRKQMAFILGENRNSFVDETHTELNDLIGNIKTSEVFLKVAKEMSLSDPKTAEDVYKSHMNSGIARRGANSNAVMDSARANLATTFVNAFVNAGHCSDALMINNKDVNMASGSWVFKNKDHGMISAVASMGLLYLWNADEAFNPLDKFFHHQDDSIKAGACLAAGIVATGVRNESDSTFAILYEKLESKSHHVRLCSILGLGIAYAGTNKEDIKELLVPIVQNMDSAFSEVCFAALALGMVFVGTCDELASDMIQRLMETSVVDLNSPLCKFFCLGLALLYLNKDEEVEVIAEAVKVIEHPIKNFAAIALEMCAYAGTGNVLKVQSFMRSCAEHLTENADHQSLAVLGIALVVLGEDMGTQMSLRTFDHLLQYGELPVKRVIPLALALLHLSHPDYSIIDQLSRLSHDQDELVSQGAIMALGLVSAGTNNSRVAGLLRQLADYYSKEANHLFVVRISQGLNAMSKGLTGLNPFHSDRLLMKKPAIAGLLTVFVACLDLKTTILDRYHYLLYALAPAISHRFLVTLNEDLEVVPVSVRVGQAVETVGQAGRPKTISGFQTHTTPVLLGAKDRAQFANKDYSTAASVLEGFVIVEKSPEDGDAESSSAKI